MIKSDTHSSVERERDYENGWGGLAAEGLSEMKTADAELCHTVLFYSAGPPVNLVNPLSQAPLRLGSSKAAPHHTGF